jgi:hypothetical protein
VKRTSFALLALSIAVAALGWFVYRHTPPEKAAAHALSTLKADAVDRISVERTGRPVVTLAKVDGSWRITAPVAAMAEPFQVQRMLALLAATSTLRLAPADLSRFELERPALTIVIGDQRFGFGMVNPVTREQYVATHDAVYAVEAQYASAVPANPASLIRRRLFDPRESPGGFQMRDFTVLRVSNRWVLRPEPADLSQDDVNRWVDEWRQAAAVRAEPADRNKLIDQVDIDLDGGKRVMLGIVQRDPELVVRRLDENVQYYFAAGTARRLLSPPGTGRK